MHKIFNRLADMCRPKYDPNPYRHTEVVRFLSQRQPLSHEEWCRRYAANDGIPLEFVAWFRDACSKYFEFDLSGALPTDRLCDDLGMYDATWGDVDWDILEDYEGEYGAKIPASEQEQIVTFGDLLKALWKHAQIPKHEQTGT